MRFITTCSSIEKAWGAIQLLEDEVRAKFVVVLPTPTRVEIWTAEGSPLQYGEKITANRIIRKIKYGRLNV